MKNGKLKRIIISSLLFLLFFPSTFSQEWKLKDKISLSGYLSDMGSLIYQKSTNTKTWDNLIHNRINLDIYATNSLTLSMQFRTRLMTGGSINSSPELYAEFIDKDNGKLDLSFNILENQKSVLNTTIDRLYIDYVIDNFQLTLGKQRINWGKTFAWNPNDIFNAYSFFDFDYVEKPGSDALRAQFYTGMASAVEFAIKINPDNKLTTALMYRFNQFNYDFQVLGGIVNEQDYILGGAWSGDIKSISFRGEFSYLKPKMNFADTSGILISSLSLGYIFPNNLSVQLEGLYNQNAKNIKINSFQDFYGMDMSVKTLSFTEYSIFGQFSYPITPLINTSLSCMYYPEIDGFFLGPTLAYSLSDNMDFSIVSQIFRGEMTPDLIETYVLGFIRLKWSY